MQVGRQILKQVTGKYRSEIAGVGADQTLDYLALPKNVW
jgi:hypothetical protein